MSISTLATAENKYEIVFTKFKATTTFAQQEQAMSSLNEVIQPYSGFISRDYFYSEANQQWVDFILWDSEHAAKHAAEDVMQQPAALEVFGLMDEGASIFSHYVKVGSIKAGDH